MNETVRNCKAIVAYGIRQEIKKTNLRPQEQIFIVGNALTALEIELQKQMKRLEDGEAIENIIPKSEIE